LCATRVREMGTKWCPCADRTLRGEPESEADKPARLHPITEPNAHLPAQPLAIPAKYSWRKGGPHQQLRGPGVGGKWGEAAAQQPQEPPLAGAQDLLPRIHRPLQEQPLLRRSRVAPGVQPAGLLPPARLLREEHQEVPPQHLHRPGETGRGSLLTVVRTTSAPEVETRVLHEQQRVVLVQQSPAASDLSATRTARCT